MSKFRACTTCQRMIYFVVNSSGKNVPMDMLTQEPHFQVCTMPPRAVTQEQRSERGKPSVEAKVYYNSSVNKKRMYSAAVHSRTLGEFA